MEINRLWHRISRLRQERGILEHKCEQAGKMLKGSYIRRYLPKGKKAFKSVQEKDIKGALPGEGKLYGYITYLKEGVTRHKYVRRRNEGEAMQLCQGYQDWSKRMARIREVNRIIVELLDKIGKIKTKGVEKYVKEKNAGRVRIKESGE